MVFESVLLSESVSVMLLVCLSACAWAYWLMCSLGCWLANVWGNLLASQSVCEMASLWVNASG